MKVVIRADGSLQLGTGHIIRCLTLADALQKGGATVNFICQEQEGHLQRLIEQKGYRVYLLPDFSLGGEDPVMTKSILKAMGKPDWLIVDHYGLDFQWEAVVQSYAHRIMVIDDMANRGHQCDLLLDQNLVENLHMRYKRLVPPGCQCLLGPEYALLDPVYHQYRSRVVPREGVIRNVLVFFGGSDRHGLTQKCLYALSKVSNRDLQVDVVIGANNQYALEIRDLVQKHKNIQSHVHLPHLADCMAKADLSLGACGSTTWERLCLGLPSLVVSLGDDQRPIAQMLHEKGLVQWLGDCKTVEAKHMVHGIENLIRQKLDKEWSLRAMDVVDGRGVYRVCDMIRWIG
jgi:UDP-2,4-diacetamido-2,4,6-trideoxy-beta-L-altropyranose hydrolase